MHAEPVMTIITENLLEHTKDRIIVWRAFQSEMDGAEEQQKRWPWMDQKKYWFGSIQEYLGIEPGNEMADIWPQREYETFQSNQRAWAADKEMTDRHHPVAQRAFVDFFGHIQVLSTAWYTWCEDLSADNDRRNQELCNQTKHFFIL